MPSANNMRTAQTNADSTVTVVIARGQLDHPNAITTHDQPRGSLAFRWFLADAVPVRPTYGWSKSETRRPQLG